jgi:hypothetical protein
MDRAPSDISRGHKSQAVASHVRWQVTEPPKGTLHSALLLSANALSTPSDSPFAVYEGEWKAPRRNITGPQVRNSCSRRSGAGPSRAVTSNSSYGNTTR